MNVLSDYFTSNNNITLVFTYKLRLMIYRFYSGALELGSIFQGHSQVSVSDTQIEYYYIYILSGDRIQIVTTVVSVLGI